MLTLPRLFLMSVCIALIASSAIFFRGILFSDKTGFPVKDHIKIMERYRATEAEIKYYYQPASAALLEESAEYNRNTQIAFGPRASGSLSKSSSTISLALPAGSSVVSA